MTYNYQLHKVSVPLLVLTTVICARAQPDVSSMRQFIYFG